MLTMINEIFLKKNNLGILSIITVEVLLRKRNKKYSG